MKPAPLPPPLLDIGEVWAAVIGVKAVLSKRVEVLTKSQFTEASKIHDTIAARAKSLVAGGIVPSKLTIIDYPLLLKQTSEAMDEAQVVAMIRAIPPRDQGPYHTVALREFTALQKALPRMSYVSQAGTQNIRPDMAKLVEFSELYAALDDPLSFLFGEIASGCMYPALVEAFSEIFPTLAKAITSAIKDAIATRTVAAKGFYIPIRVEAGVAAWMGEPPELPAPSAAPPPPPDEEKDDGKVEDASDALTPADKIESAS